MPEFQVTEVINFEKGAAVDDNFDNVSHLSAYYSSLLTPELRATGKAGQASLIKAGLLPDVILGNAEGVVLKSTDTSQRFEPSSNYPSRSSESEELAPGSNTVQVTRQPEYSARIQSPSSEEYLSHGTN